MAQFIHFEASEGEESLSGQGSAAEEILSSGTEEAELKRLRRPQRPRGSRQSRRSVTPAPLSSEEEEEEMPQPVKRRPVSESARPRRPLPPEPKETPPNRLRPVSPQAKTEQAQSPPLTRIRPVQRSRAPSRPREESNNHLHGRAASRRSESPEAATPLGDDAPVQAEGLYKNPSNLEDSPHSPSEGQTATAMQRRGRPLEKRRAYVREEEEEMPEEPAVAPPKARKVSRSTARAPVLSESEAEVEELEEGEDRLVIDEGGPLKDPLEQCAQRAMGCVVKICELLRLKTQGVGIEPTNAVWSKIGGAFVQQRHADYRRTFSNHESFNTQIGRFVAAMVYGKCELEPKFLPGGAYIWRHGWFLEDSELPKCLHGREMRLKPRSIEMNPSSEAGKRAIAEQGAQMGKNRWGRDVVVIRYDHNCVCFKDADHNGFPEPHARGSCAMVFSDMKKAASAMRHDLAWTKALYPNANSREAQERLLICAQCMCNYGSEEPIPGRQVCRMTPYKLFGSDEITEEVGKRRADMRAHREHPHTMVYGCCNPQSSNGKRWGAQQGGSTSLKNKTCSWQLSYMDLRYAYVFAHELMTEAYGRPWATGIREFKWTESFAYKTDVIQSVHPVESADLFA